MSIIQATIRSTKTKGEVNELRNSGNVPGIVYGGEQSNEKISISIKEIKNLMNKENFLSNVISIHLDGNSEHNTPGLSGSWMRNATQRIYPRFSLKGLI